MVPVCKRMARRSPRCFLLLHITATTFILFYFIFCFIRVLAGLRNRPGRRNSTNPRIRALPVSPNVPSLLLAGTSPTCLTTKGNVPFGTNHKQLAQPHHSTPHTPTPSSSPYVRYASDATSIPCQSSSAQPLAHGTINSTPTARESTKLSKPGKEVSPYAASGNVNAAVVNDTTTCTHVPDAELAHMAPADALVLRKCQPRTPYKAEAWQQALQ